MADTESVGTKYDAATTAGGNGTVIALLKLLTTQMGAGGVGTQVEGAVAAGASVTGVNPVLIAGGSGTTGTGNATVPRVLANGDGLTIASQGLVVAAPAYQYNLSDLELTRGNVEVAGYISAVGLTSTQSGATITNPNARGIMMFLDITSNPGGAETLALDLQVIAPTAGTFQSIAASQPFTAASNGLFTYQIYPGITEASDVAAQKIQGMAIPRKFRVRVIHSSTGAWSYTLGYCLIV
jgi:hypothetical protein